MHAIVQDGPRLAWAEVETPAPGPGEVRVRVCATAVNRADLVQRAGLYPPPPGASPILGLECSGWIDAVGPDVSGWAVGDAVCALLSGGGYAEAVVVPAGQLFPAPTSLPLAHAAALPEAVCTVHDALWTQADLVPGERVLLHAGASGIGTTAIQLCRERGNPCFVVCGSAEKIARCVALGAEAGADRHAGPWADHPWLADGVDAILDPVGGTTLDDGIRALRPRGRLVLIGLMGGRSAPLDLARVMTRRLRVIGSVLRSRSAAEKADVVAAARRDAWPLVEAGRLVPAIHAEFSITDTESAHALVASDATVGKVLLTVGQR